MKTIQRKTLFILIAFVATTACAQNSVTDSFKIDYKKLYAYALDGRIKPALGLLPSAQAKISEPDNAFVIKFKDRFAYADDKSEFYPKNDSSITGLLNIYRNYWRSSLLNNSRSFDTALCLNLVSFLKQSYAPAGPVEIKQDGGFIMSFLGKYLKEYIESKGMLTTGFGRTGAYLDLLVWKKEKDTTYHLNLTGDPVNVKVVFMDDFVSLGWEDYATLGKHYPGGWATKDALHCVRKAYDLNSENFRVSYLAHEGRHFADYKEFPKLTSADLEYRAKLTELSFAKTTLYKSIEFFINNSNYEGSNSHSIANFCVIRDLSQVLFKNDFEKDLIKWQALSVKKINKESKKLLQKNTRELRKKGVDVEYFIKEKRA